jgi:orotidine-5'-phosphate decarboxylase
MTKGVIVALDVSGKDELSRLLEPLKDIENLYVKVGMELFYQEGPDLVKKLKSEGHRIFLDLKLHDIPTTVYKAMRGLARLNVDMVNVHAAGGSLMMSRAAEGLEEGVLSGHERPLCLAVTQLTSTDQEMLNNEMLIQGSMDDAISTYARTAYKAGLDGVVCSPWEAAMIKEATHQGFLTVTPGIRLLNDASDDQKRVATPAKAKELGADYIVVGRSITANQNVKEAYQKVSQEWGI